ncbi:MAG: Stk1 family PASTA domain-containing Ser/Thr kinase [Ruminococcaceae bacterium]|nr:Stk1 family PASTA domain-containing Ser/Thr kinase [Oscillospiraceae bacterium]
MERDAFARYIGQVFDNRYRITKILGIGGMAVVFEAVDTLMHRTVAIKMLKDNIAGDPAAVRRFINESKAVSMLHHPNIVAIYDVSVKENLKYIVMEKVEGLTLKKYMTQKGALPAKEALLYVRQILAALSHAHDKGITHRDIKPQNVMLLKNGGIKVTDFGIAKLPNAETLTATDKAIGTVFYISPEQASGKKIDQRSDLYSLGVVLYEMVTGELPFNADSPVSVAIMQVSAEPRRPREILHSIPVGIEQIILKAMQKQPEKRFQTAAQMAESVERLLQDPAVVFKPRQLKGNSGQFPVSGQPEAPKRPAAGRNKKVHRSKKPRRKERFTMFPVILGILTAFLLVGAVTGVYVLKETFFKAEEKNTVTIPQFIGDILTDEMETQLTSQGYKLTVTGIYSDEYPADTIIDQTPVKGEKRVLTPGRPSCDLKLTVSLGSEVVEISDFTLADRREAEIALEKLGLVVAFDTEPSNLVPEGDVTRTVPASGATVKVGDTVTVYLSSGPDLALVRVPSFTGKDEATVARLLKENGLAVGYVERVFSDEPAGTVIWQSIEADAEVAQGMTEIDFRVSKGPDPDATSETAMTAPWEDPLDPNAPFDPNDPDHTEHTDIPGRTDPVPLFTTAPPAGSSSNPWWWLS